MPLVDPDAVTLAECPVGLFRSSYGGLCLKTEYGDNEGRIDAYIVSSGEFFWGDQPQTIASQRAQLVTPIDENRLLDAIRALPSHTVQSGSEVTEWQIKAVGSNRWSNVDANVAKTMQQSPDIWDVRPLYAAPPPAIPVDAVAVIEEMRAAWEKSRYGYSPTVIATFNEILAALRAKTQETGR